MRESSRRHRDGDGAQQQADDRRQRQETLRTIRGVVCPLAAFLLAANAHRLGQLVFDCLIEIAHRCFVAGNQQRIADAAPLADQPAAFDVPDVHQQRRCQRCKADGLIGPIGQDCRDLEVELPDRQGIANIRRQARQQRAVGPDLPGSGHAIDFALLTEHLVGDPHGATQRIVVADDLERR